MQETKDFSFFNYLNTAATPIVIAEAGVNHNGCFEEAIRLIDAAYEAGAQGVKFQSFKAEKLALKETPKVPYQLKDEAHKGESHYEMLKRLEMDYCSMQKLKKHADARGLLFLSTPYDPESARELVKIGVGAIKVASADLIDYSIHQEILRSGLPLMQGLGMSRDDEVESLVNFYYKNNPHYPIVLLQCTSNYPANPLNANLNFIPCLQEKYPQAMIGFSDHTNGSETACLALAKGTRVFEKHFTRDRSQSGPDHKASCDPQQLKEYIDALKRSDEILGDGEKKIAEEEKKMRRISRKGAYLCVDIKFGEVISEDKLQFTRPALDFPMSEVYYLLGHKASHDLNAGHLLRKDDFLEESC
ncbi:MAG: N-acetylneuraminate synthase family protein [Planctomycetes bacterium]|nr:N-acetylneuraminate synthase family protein [Planctomycetota bacterium]